MLFENVSNEVSDILLEVLSVKVVVKAVRDGFVVLELSRSIYEVTFRTGMKHIAFTFVFKLAEAFSHLSPLQDSGVFFIFRTPDII